MSQENGTSHVSSPSVRPNLRAPVSVMIFTLDEEPNLPGCLDSLRWCDDVIVVDSYSRDRTERIAKEGGARFFQNRFEGHGTQRNWAIDNTSPKHDWILVLDADERVPDEMAEEMASVLSSSPPEIGAYRLKRRFHLWGRWLEHSSLYPTWIVRLIHKDRVRYKNRGHAETQDVAGEIGELRTDLIDANEKGIVEWFDRQTRYARKDAEHELEAEQRPLAATDLFSRDPLVQRSALKRLGYRAPLRAPLYFLYAYLVRGGFRDGDDGLAFCTMRALYFQMVNVHKYDLRKIAAKGRPRA
jgi:glycosyltransferase involved in cell wall biosynthesis